MNGWPVLTRPMSTSAPRPLERNIPVIMGLLGVWYINFWGADTHAMLPTTTYLAPFCDYLQQIDTESNGKCVTKPATPVEYDTGPIVWGRPRNRRAALVLPIAASRNGLVPCDFFVAARIRQFRRRPPLRLVGPLFRADEGPYGRPHHRGGTD